MSPFYCNFTKICKDTEQCAEDFSMVPLGEWKELQKLIPWDNFLSFTQGKSCTCVTLSVAIRSVNSLLLLQLFITVWTVYAEC